jgi:hypothetical protein
VYTGTIAKAIIKAFIRGNLKAKVKLACMEDTGSSNPIHHMIRFSVIMYFILKLKSTK